MTTLEEEWKQALEFRDQYGQEPQIVEAGNLVSKFFARHESMGVLRLKESPYYRSELQKSSEKAHLFKGGMNRIPQSKTRSVFGLELLYFRG